MFMYIAFLDRILLISWRFLVVAILHSSVFLVILLKEIAWKDYPAIGNYVILHVTHCNRRTTPVKTYN